MVKSGHITPGDHDPCDEVVIHLKHAQLMAPIPGCFSMALRNGHPLLGCIVGEVKTFALLSALPRAFLCCFSSWILFLPGLSDASEMQGTEVPRRIHLPSAPVVPIGMGISYGDLSL